MKLKYSKTTFFKTRTKYLIDAETVKFIRTLISLAHFVLAMTKIPISPKWKKWER